MKKNKTTILIADDDQDLLDQSVIILEKEGFTVIACDSQNEAEKIFTEKMPDLAIFDLMMDNPDSGFILSYKLKKLSPETPVIIITGVTSDSGMRFDTLSDGKQNWIKADLVLDKDLRYEQLIHEINKLLDK